MTTVKRRRTAKRSGSKKRTSKHAFAKKALRKRARARTKAGGAKAVGRKARPGRSVTVMSAKSVYETLDISDTTVRDVRRAIGV